MCMRRFMLELAVPVWHPGLTKKKKADIESIQKVAFRIILQNDYVTYQLALTLDKVEPKSESLNLTLQGSRRAAYLSWPNCSTQPSGRNNLYLKIKLYSCYLWMMGSWPGRCFFSIV